MIIANLQEQLECSKQKPVGSSSKKRNDLPGQLNLFSETVSEEELVLSLLSGTIPLICMMIILLYHHGMQPCTAIYRCTHLRLQGVPLSLREWQIFTASCRCFNSSRACFTFLLNATYSFSWFDGTQTRTL